MLSVTEEIKNKLDIKEIVGQYVKLEKAGSSYRALCPFHREKTPSFFVSPERQSWHCFGCGLGGDIFSFVMKIENIEFPEALKILAQKAGVPLARENPRLQSQKQKLADINQEASRFFQKNLQENKEAGDYLKQRGLSEETIKEFHLGWAPDEWRSLSDFLINKRFSPQDIVDSGLAISKREPTEINARAAAPAMRGEDIYDRFRARIMFPIEDYSRNIAGFTGRIFAGQGKLQTVKDLEKTGKYVNSPQTLIYDKSKILYGLNQSKNYLRHAPGVLLVEGQMDFLAAWQAGVKNIVATSGCALSPYQLKVLKRYNGVLILGFDMDEAGELAAERSIEMALLQGFDVKILRLPQGKDLADYLQQEGAKEELKNLIDQAEAVMDFYLARAEKQGNADSVEGKKAIASYLLPKIKKLPNVLDRSFWINKLSRLIKIPDQAIEDELEKISTDVERSEAQDENESLYQFPAAQLQSRLESIAERIISFVVKNPAWREKVNKYEEYFPSSFQEIWAVVGKAATEKDLSDASLKKANLSEETINRISQLALRADYETELLGKFKVTMEEELQKELQELKREFIKKKLAVMEQSIQEAEEQSDQKSLPDLMAEFNQWSKKLLE